MLVSYESQYEVIVCDVVDEGVIRKEYFLDGGRDLDDYDRITHTPHKAIAITYKAKVSP